MTIEVFLAVMLAAVMHAGWNAIIKVKLDRFLSISLMSICQGLLGLCVIPFVAVPHGTTWFWILLSSALHTGYKLFLIKAYSAGDLAQVYPLARGAAPLLTALAAFVLFGEELTSLMVLAIIVLSLGIAAMSARGGSALRQLDATAICYALGTSVFIAGYTLTDGAGGRTAPSASSYAVWMFAIDGLWIGIFCFALRGRHGFDEMLPEWKSGFTTGALSLGAYWIVIWAMTRAPIAAVAALRETSILFAMLISLFILRERLTPWRIISAILIVAGVVGLRIA